MNWIFHTCTVQINQQKKKTNNFAFENTKGQQYVFDAIDKHNDTCPKHFKLKNDSSQKVGLHSKIQIKICMLIELCVGNYATHNDLLNGANEVFQYVSKLHDSESHIWIAFNIPNVCSKTLDTNTTNF
jgi:hypothetical protein